MSTPEQTKQLSPIDHARSFLARADFKEQIKNALPKHLTPERMLRMALTAATRTPKLAECFNSQVGKASVAQSLLTASQLGLEVDGRQGHLVPFRDNKKNAMTCQFVPGYQGLIGLAYNHPQVKTVWAEVVFERDHFVERKGSERELTHEPYDGDDDPGPLKAAYAVCQMDNGAKTWVVLRKRDINRIMKSSATAKYPDSIWQTNPEPMWKKSAIRQLAKFIPQSSQLQKALDVDDETESADEDRFAAAKPVFDSDPLLGTATETQPIQSGDEAAEAEAGLAPETKKEPKPADAPANSPHAELAVLLEQNGITYSSLQKWAIENTFYPDADSFPSLEELPEGAVKKLLKNKVGLINQLRGAAK